MDVRIAVAIGIGIVALVGVGSFLVSPATSAPEPVEFDQTVSMGLTLEERRGLGEERFVPRAQVAYSQYPYVVGYRGLGLAATAVDDPLVRQQFGYPQVVYVESAPSAVTLDEDGYLVGDATRRWIDASDAYFVVDSDARTPSGPTPVAFEDETRADAFASSHGGRVLEWSDRERFDRARSDGTAARDRVDTQHDAADEVVTDAHELFDRSDEVVVGEDAPTLQAALDAAEANATVRLPPGTYDGPVVIDESITLVGDDAVISGDGDGTVLTVRADDVAISGVAITGVGDALRDDDVDADDWDRQTEEAYGYSDAGVVAADVDRVFVHDTHIETPASGVVLRDVNRSVVDGVSVEGTDDWRDGFMGVVAMRSPAVVQNSTFVDGRDGVYTHRAAGVTIRDNEFVGGRFGVHLMYTSDALAAGNCVTGQDLAGLVVMTSPSGVAFTDNVVVGTEQGIATSGSDAYVGENVVVDTRQGITTSARNSLYADNTVVGNDVGFRASAIFPTSVVVGNDVADNDRHVKTTTGPLRVWSRDGEGNYWSGAERLDRPYSPTDPVDGRLHRSDAARTLSAAPVVAGIRELRGSAPGMRVETVVDAAPRETPADESRLEAARALADGTATQKELGLTPGSAPNPDSERAAESRCLP